MRLNLVPPSELMKAHLFSEWREIKMWPTMVHKAVERHGVEHVLARVTPVFTLGKGHALHFADKGLYLEQRYAALTVELRVRGVSFNEGAVFDPWNVYQRDVRLRKDYEPSDEALVLIRERLATRISERPGWYRY